LDSARGKLCDRSFIPTDIKPADITAPVDFGRD
jgi:hypothetical protein